jgi:hypothetical protein
MPITDPTTSAVAVGNPNAARSTGLGWGVAAM